MAVGGVVSPLSILGIGNEKSVDGLDDNGEINPEGHGATLVVAPLAAVLQWKQEIERFSKPQSLTVILYHGSCREALLRCIHKYDVVITTYSIVESDYRRVINTHKVVCKVCFALRCHGAYVPKQPCKVLLYQC